MNSLSSHSSPFHPSHHPVNPGYNGGNGGNGCHRPRGSRGGGAKRAAKAAAAARANTPHNYPYHPNNMNPNMNNDNNNENQEPVHHNSYQNNPNSGFKNHVQRRMEAAKRQEASSHQNIQGHQNNQCNPASPRPLPSPRVMPPQPRPTLTLKTTFNLPPPSMTTEAEVVDKIYNDLTHTALDVCMSVLKTPTHGRRQSLRLKRMSMDGESPRTPGLGSDTNSAVKRRLQQQGAVGGGGSYFETSPTSFLYGREAKRQRR